MKSVLNELKVFISGITVYPDTPAELPIVYSFSYVGGIMIDESDTHTKVPGGH